MVGEPRKSLDPELLSIPEPQFTMAFETMVGEPPRPIEIPTAPSMSVNPHSSASAVAPENSTAAVPAGGKIYVAHGPAVLMSWARLAPNWTDSL